MRGRRDRGGRGRGGNQYGGRLWTGRAGGPPFGGGGRPHTDFVWPPPGATPRPPAQYHPASDGYSAHMVAPHQAAYQHGVVYRPPSPSPAPAPHQLEQVASQVPASAPLSSAPSTAALAKEVQQKLFVSETALAPPAATASAAASKERPAAAAEASDVDLAPVSKKGLALPAWPGPETMGKKVMIRANHFLVNVSDNNLFHYDVAINPESKSRPTHREVLNELIKLHGKTSLGGKLPAYDGRESLYTAGSLPFESEEFVVKLVDPEKRDKERVETEYKITIRIAGRTDLYHLQQFLRGRQRDMPQENIQVLDVVLRESPSCYVTVSRSFFSTDFGHRGDIGEGLECWRGYYQSLRPTPMGLSLNIDIPTTSFFKPVTVIQFVEEFLNLRDTSRPLSDRDRVKIKKALQGVCIETNHQEDQIRRHKITGIAPIPTSQLIFPVDNQGTRMTVVQYFLERYNYRLKYASWPCLQAGSDPRPVYLPTELRYHESGRERTCALCVWQWNMINKKMINGGTVQNWACFSLVRLEEVQRFCGGLIPMCNATGMAFYRRPLIDIRLATPNNLKNALGDVHRRTTEMLAKQGAGNQLQLLIVILPEVSGSYGKIKMVCDTDLGIVSQCCLPKHASRPNKQYLENFGLKINVKVGGRNTAHERTFVRNAICFVSQVPTIICGADVTHPPPGEDSASSIAAVVALSRVLLQEMFFYMYNGPLGLGRMGKGIDARESGVELESAPCSDSKDEIQVFVSYLESRMIFQFDKETTIRNIAAVAMMRAGFHITDFYVRRQHSKTKYNLDDKLLSVNLEEDLALEIVPRLRGGSRDDVFMPVLKWSFSARINSITNDQFFELRSAPSVLIPPNAEIKPGMNIPGEQLFLGEMGWTVVRQLLAAIAILHKNGRSFKGRFRSADMVYLPMVDRFTFDTAHVEKFATEYSSEGYILDMRSLAHIIEKLCNRHNSGVPPAYISHLVYLLKSVNTFSATDETFHSMLQSHCSTSSPKGRIDLALSLDRHIRFQEHSIQTTIRIESGDYNLRRNLWDRSFAGCIRLEDVFWRTPPGYSSKKYDGYSLRSWLQFFRDFITHPKGSEPPEFTSEEVDAAFYFNHGDVLAEFCLRACKFTCQTQPPMANVFRKDGLSIGRIWSNRPGVPTSSEAGPST